MQVFIIGCQHKYNKENGTISIANFPTYQYCSWSLTVNQGSVISLTFTSLNIPSCSENHMNIYDGLDDTSPLLINLCGKNGTSGIRIHSTGNNMFLTLASGNSQNIQFQADFQSKEPISGIYIYFPLCSFEIYMSRARLQDTIIL